MPTLDCRAASPLAMTSPCWSRRARFNRYSDSTATVSVRVELMLVGVR